MTDRPTLEFVPLGGTGEIGMNLNLYGIDGQWLMVDAGVMFERGPDGNNRALYPDPTFIATVCDRVLGIVITHAHQDHLGAVADLWPVVRCPVYATPFAAAMLEGPLEEAGLTEQVPIRLLTESASLRVGPFDLTRIPLTHSTVEMGALLIRAGTTTVLHTGDWKLDPEPIVGTHTDEGAFRRLAEEGVDVLVSDSTNADLPGWTPSEGILPASLRKIFAGKSRRIAVPFFSTNVARLQTLGALAAELQRNLVLVGRSLERTVGAAQRVGYLEDLPAIAPARHFGYLPPERVLLLCTGSQGEPNAALGRIAADEHPLIYLEPGDAVVFSARVIPGSEDAVERLVMHLRQKQIDVVTADDALVHVSGHPRQDELRTLYDWVKPKWVLPVHGTPAKLEAHAALAEDMGIGAIRARNGDRLLLGATPVRRIESAPTGRVEREERIRSPRTPGRRPRVDRADRRDRRSRRRHR